MEYVIVRSAGARKYELLDPEGHYIGNALSLAQLHRFAEAEGVPLGFETGPDAPVDGRPRFHPRPGGGAVARQACPQLTERSAAGVTKG